MSNLSTIEDSKVVLLQQIPDQAKEDIDNWKGRQMGEKEEHTTDYKSMTYNHNWDWNSHVVEMSHTRFYDLLFATCYLPC